VVKGWYLWLKLEVFSRTGWYEFVPLLINLKRAELTSEEIVFLMVGMLIFFVVGIKLVPLFKSSMRSGGRLMSVKLCIILVDVSFSFSASSSDFRARLQSI